MFLRVVGNANPACELASLCDSLNSKQIESDCWSNLFGQDAMTFEPYKPLRRQNKIAGVGVLHSVKLSSCDLFIMLKNQTAFDCPRFRHLRPCLAVTIPRGDYLLFWLESESAKPSLTERIE